MDAPLEAGDDLRQAQKLLGHKSEAMTRHYTEGKYHKRVKPARWGGGLPTRNRTWNPQLRRLVLYPVELWAGGNSDKTRNS